jgi:hypothetical protein
MPAGVPDAVRDRFAGAWDSGDPWGSSMGLHFAICDRLADADADIPDEWQFSQSPMGSDVDAYEYQELEGVSVADLLEAGAVLHAFEERMQAEGCDY